ILLAGEAGRYGALWAAVELSDIHGPLGVLVLALGPLAVVSALIAALYALRHSLRSVSDTASISNTVSVSDTASVSVSDAVSAAPSAPVGSSGGAAQTIGRVLVPFLVIYESYGYLEDDVFRFVNTAVADEMFDVDVLLGTDTIDPNRTALATGWAAMLVVAVALVLRFGFSALVHHRRITSLVWVIAYLEALWLATLARTLVAHVGAAFRWLRENAAVQMAIDGWHGVVAATGPLADAINRAVAWMVALIGSVDTVIVAPLAWLAVGAVVYGRELGEPVRRMAAHRAGKDDRLSTRVPQPVRAAAQELTSTVTEPFGDVGAGLRRLALAGLMPLALFTVSFMAAQRLEHVLNLAWREILGPMPLGTMLAFSPHMAMVSHAIGTTVVVCLLGATIDWVFDRGSSSDARVA
ncbi:hypothetical protein, partial [Phytoactinopolyspora endophytica]|uniref:hypothetical protein n=1 Tax=Phytoactinopolyspora endophytica TaxID=1642495 RepID=UPI0013EA6609